MVILRIEAVNGKTQDGDDLRPLEAVLNDLEQAGYKVISHAYTYGDCDLYEVVLTQKEDP